MKPLSQFRSTCAVLLVALKMLHVSLGAAAIDAIFFISVASEQHISLSECHISFWTLGSSTEKCREGCSAVGGARIGLNTFETNFSNGRDSLTYLLTLQCPQASVTVDYCPLIEHQLFLPHELLIVLKPTDTPVNLGRLIVGLPRTPAQKDHGNSSPAELGSVVAAYIGWIVSVALAWMMLMQDPSTGKTVIIFPGRRHAPRYKRL